MGADFRTDDQALLVLVRHLATILRALGRDSEARDRSMECYGKLRRVYGDDDEEALSAGNVVGGTYRGLGRFRDALALDQDLYDRHVRIFGDEHPRTLMSQNNLALDYFLMGDYDRAAASMRRSCRRAAVSWVRTTRLPSSRRTVMPATCARQGSTSRPGTSWKIPSVVTSPSWA